MLFWIIFKDHLWLKIYIQNSYHVDVLKRNSGKLVYDQELYSKYYSVIEKLYKIKSQNWIQDQKRICYCR